MNQQSFDLVLILVAVFASFFLFYQLLQLIKTRPDVVAVLSFAAVGVGLVMMSSGDESINGFLVIVAGVVGVFVAALNYRRVSS